MFLELFFPIYEFELFSKNSGPNLRLAFRFLGYLTPGPGELGPGPFELGPPKGKSCGRLCGKRTDTVVPLPACRSMAALNLALKIWFCR